MLILEEKSDVGQYFSQYFPDSDFWFLFLLDGFLGH